MTFQEFLALLGFPKTNAQGHELGCICEVCTEARRVQASQPPKPGTLGHLLLEARRKGRPPPGVVRTKGKSR